LINEKKFLKIEKNNINLNCGVTLLIYNNNENYLNETEIVCKQCLNTLFNLFFLNSNIFVGSGLSEYFISYFLKKRCKYFLKNNVYPFGILNFLIF
jgi:hypothetical protein